MALPWLVALKVIPWGDVIEHAPKVLNAARKLMERQKTPRPAPPAPATPARPAATAPDLQALETRLQETQQLLDHHAGVQEQMARTVAELAEQNARLVDAVDKLRVRTRMLLGVAALLALGLLWLVLR